MAVPTASRLFSLQNAMRDRGAHLVVVGPTVSLRYLLDYEAIALERLTCLLVTESRAVMIMPDFDSSEFKAATGLGDVETWTDRDGPKGAVRSAFGRLQLPDDPVTLIDEELPFRFLTALREEH